MRPWRPRRCFRRCGVVSSQLKEKKNMKPLSRVTAIMVLLFSLSAVALAGDMDGPSGIVTPPPPPPPTVTDNLTTGGATGTEGDSFSTSYLIERLLAAIF